jgi:hypothetical protein
MHELVWRADLEMTALRWPLLRKPKTGFARASAIFAKKLRLTIAPLEDVFVEYAFELANPAEKRSLGASSAELAAAQTN